MDAAAAIGAASADVAKAYEAAYDAAVATEFAASGLLRQRIEEGDGSDVFASARTGSEAAGAPAAG